MSIRPILPTQRRASTRPMEPAYVTSVHRWRSAPRLGAFRHCGTLARVNKTAPLVHGVARDFFFCPPRETLPTMAWPPSFTVTCSTVIFRSPPVRYFFRASICVVKVRANLFGVIEMKVEFELIVNRSMNREELFPGSLHL